ncbi:MAG: TonB-dependent receptor [Bacteroidales bacterium]|nr:TonB-dependent receptor [Bacteroidales bacterium]
MKRKLYVFLACVLGVTGLMFAQNQTITGSVVSADDGQAVIGAYVMIAGSNDGTTTDANGQFVLSVKPGATLRFSYLGMESLELPAQNGMKVTMQADTKDLDDVVVIGYGTMKRRDLTGAISSIAPKDIVAAPTNNIMEALQGRISGLDIVQSSGAVGSNPSVMLRGARSIYGNNSPLIVIDGVIMPTTTIVDKLVVNTADNSVVQNVNDYFSQVNPADIESIDVLKDAASTAIYGSAGANGVILITTKKGKEGITTVNFDSYFGVKGTPMYKHGMQGQEWLDYYHEAYKNKNGADFADMSTLFGGNTYYLDAYNAGQWIDWVDEAVNNGKKATTQKYSLSVSTGNAKQQVYSSLSYTSDQGLMPMEKGNKMVFRLNADQQVFDWAKIGLVTNSTFSLNNTANPVFGNAVSRLPLGLPYDEYGNLQYFYIGQNAGNGQISPLADWRTNQYANQTKSVYLQPTAYLEIKPMNDLTFKTQIGGSHANVNRGKYYGSECWTQSPHYVGYVIPYAEIYTQNEWAYTWDNIVTWNKNFNEDHNLVLTALTSWNYRQLVDNYTGSKGQELDAWLFYRMGGGNDFYVDSNYKQTQQMSYAGRAAYSFKGKYLATASIRYDGVSWLSEGKKWDYFPSLALAWRLSDEEFMEDTKDFIDNLKIRASYGVTGNSGGMSAYATASGMYKYPANISVDGPNSPNAGGITQYTSTYGNAGIGWEKSYNWNLGLDFSILNNLLDGTIEYYDTKTKGLLYSRAIPATTGFTGWGWTLASWQNLGETMNRGLEVTLTSHNIRTKDFTWNTSLNLAWQTDKIVNLPGGNFKDNTLGWFFEGESINSVYDYKYVGIWQADEAAEAALYGAEPGAVKIETVPNDADAEPGVHLYTENDKQVLGTYTPKYIAGLNNTFTFQGFDATVYLMGRFGHLVSYSYYNGSDNVTSNQPSGVDYYTAANTDAYYYAPGLNNNPAASACNYLAGDFVKIKNITLGYTLPRTLTKKAAIDRLRVYGTAYNPAVWTKATQLKGVDPESSSSRYPLYRQFVFGLNITF